MGRQSDGALAPHADPVILPVDDGVLDVVLVLDGTLERRWVLPRGIPVDPLYQPSRWPLAHDKPLYRHPGDLLLYHLLGAQLLALFDLSVYRGLPLTAQTPAGDHLARLL